MIDIGDNKEIEIITYETENIRNLIYTIRGKQVILDSDVAMLYDTETRIINQTVKRNIERFPEKFGFQLTDKEFSILRSQFVILKSKANSGKVMRKYNPYVFTEQGIVMLSGLLRSEIAIKVSINIIEAFVEMRKVIQNNKYLFNRVTKIENELLEHNQKFDTIFNELLRKEKTEFTQKIFFNGQIYDSYSLIIDIIKKFNLQYPSLKITYTNRFHDRFILLDNKELYHCGASLKDLGKKCFAITKIEDEEYIEKMYKLV